MFTSVFQLPLPHLGEKRRQEVVRVPFSHVDLLHHFLKEKSVLILFSFLHLNFVLQLLNFRFIKSFYEFNTFF